MDIFKRKHNNFVVLLVLLVLGILVAIFGSLWNENVRIQDPSEQISTVSISFIESNNEVIAEVADTLESRSIGLMNRKDIDEDKGMLFVFDEDVRHGFWMKDTLIPLDMIFIDSEYRIVDIIADVPICTTPTCRSYVPNSVYRYVLEVNGGYTLRNDVRIGTEVVVEDIR